MLRCGRCGCTKFVFTMPGDNYSRHHGAVCAACQKRLSMHDLVVRATDISSTCGKTDHHSVTDCRYTAKSLYP